MPSTLINLKREKPPEQIPFPARKENQKTPKVGGNKIIIPNFLMKTAAAFVALAPGPKPRFG